MGLRLPAVALDSGLLLVSYPLKENKDDRYAWARQAGLLATIPFLLAVPPIIGVLIGRYLDDRFNTNPILTIVLLIFGFAASIREVATVLKKAGDGSDKKKSDDGDTR
jgi:ATP synthase protein I